MRRNGQWPALLALTFSLALLPHTSATAQEPEATDAPAPTSDAPFDRKAMDARVNKAVVEVIRQGVELYNAGDRAGCYRLYQGALGGLTPGLFYRDDLAQRADSALQRAASLGDAGQAAFALRDVLNEIYENTRTNKTLWDRLGGQEAVEAVVHDFVVLAASDQDVNFFRDGRYNLDEQGVERLETLLVELISSATGGPLEYTGRDMKSLHEGMAITESEFNALAADLVAVLKKYEVPEKDIEALMAVVGTTKDDIVEEPAPEAEPTTEPAPEAETEPASESEPAPVQGTTP